MHPYLEKLKLLFLRPSAFFKSVRKEKDYWEVLKFYVILAASLNIFVFLLDLPFSIREGMAAVEQALLSTVLGIIFAFVIPFIGAALIHLGVIILSGKQGFFNTFKPTTYSLAVVPVYMFVVTIISTIILWLNLSAFDSLKQEDVAGLLSIPSAVYAIIIISVGFAVVYMIHSTIVNVIGLAIFQKMSKLRAFCAILISILIIIIVAAIFGAGIGIIVYLISQAGVPVT